MGLANTRIGTLMRSYRLISDVALWLETFQSVKVRDEIINWIRLDQLKAKGENADGEVIGYYSYATELISGGEKQEGTPYTLDDTGEFYKSMYMVVLTDAIVFEANPIKGNDNLFNKYGSNILNLNTTNRAKLAELVKNKYIEKIRKILLRP